MLNSIHAAEESQSLYMCQHACTYVCMHVTHLCLFYLQNAEFKKENGFILVVIAFSILLCIEELILLATRSAVLVMNLQAGNEPASPSTYLPFSLLVLMANCTSIPFILREMEKLERCSVFFVWNVDTSEGDKSFSNKEKRIKTGRNYVFFDTLSAVFLHCCDYKEIIFWCIYIYIYIICGIQTDTPPLKKHTVPRHGKRTTFSFWSSSQTQ